MSTVLPQILFATNNIEIAAWRASATLTLVVVTPRPLDPTHRWYKYAMENGLGLVGVRALQPNAYWPAEVAEAARRLGPPRADERRVGLGWSYGGHVVIRHALDFGLTASLTASAAYSADPALVPLDAQRLVAARIPDGLRALAIVDDRPARGGVRMWKLADPATPAEAAHATRLNARGVRTLPTFHVGHSTMNLLDNTTTLRVMLEALLADDFNAALRGLRAARKRLLAYPVLLAAASVERGRADWARRLLARVDAMGWRVDSREFDVIVMTHFRCGNLERAMQLATHAIERQVTRPVPYEIACGILRQRGRHAEAAELLARGLAVCPESVVLRRLAERVAAERLEQAREAA